MDLHSGLSSINQVEISNDKILTDVSSDGWLTVYDLKSGKQIVKVTGCGGENIECFSRLKADDGRFLVMGGDDGMCYVGDIRKMESTNDLYVHHVGRVQRDDMTIKKIIRCGNTDDFILFTGTGSLWQWRLTVNKELEMETAMTLNEWTGNQNFGINDVASMHDDDKQSDKMFVATKDGQIKEYAML